MKENYIKNEFAEIWIEDGIGRAVITLEGVLTLEIAKKIVEDRLRVSAGITRPGLIDINKIMSVNTEARKYLTEKPSTLYVNATGIFVRSAVAMMVANFLIRLNPTKIPVRIFTDKTKALNWLEQYKNSK